LPRKRHPGAENQEGEPPPPIAELVQKGETEMALKIIEEARTNPVIAKIINPAAPEEEKNDADTALPRPAPSGMA
jgi:hypothetical protein